MKKLPKQARNRREVCIGALRYATLGLLTTGGAALFIKRQQLIREGVCINEGICHGCKALEYCDLPLAHVSRASRPRIAGETPATRKLTSKRGK